MIVFGLCGVKFVAWHVDPRDGNKAQLLVKID
jgi:hypothetical protein